MYAITCAVGDQHFIQLGYALVSSGVPLTQCFARCWYACHHHCSS
jgi:hypothetical protein